MENLELIAKRLELLEETLIYRFLERVQFAQHPELYRGTSPAEVLRYSLLGLRLRASEAIEEQFGRYTVAEEFPFSPFTSVTAATPQTKPLKVALHIVEKLDHSKQNIEAELPLSLSLLREISQCQNILAHYLKFLSHHCSRDEKKQYGSPQQGSALEHDLMALQAISRRIHYGALYVAEIKFCQQEDALRPLILKWQNAAGDSKIVEQILPQILSLITRIEVEQGIVQRVYQKAKAIQANNPSNFQRESGPWPPEATMQRHYLEPRTLRDFYADCVIPLTKSGELAYLYRRVV